MNGMLHDLLKERADAAGNPGLDLQGLISLGERRVARRRRLVLAATATAVTLTVGATFGTLQAGERTTSPVGPPPTAPTRTEDVVPETTAGSRPLTYGLGATVHYGDRVIEAAEDVGGLYVFDESVAILTGRNDAEADNRLYLLDGSEQVEIARGIERVTAGEVGSLLVWLDGDDVVIYDIQVRREVARVPLNGRSLINPITPLEDAVYWHESTRDKPIRYDVQTGTRASASQAEYRAETRAADAPVLVVGSADSGIPAENFEVVDSRLVADNAGRPAPQPVFVAATGERLRVSVPDGYDGEALSLFQSLDEDRFALVVSNAGVGTLPIGDLLACSISAGQCHAIASGEQEWVLPGNDGAIH